MKRAFINCHVVDVERGQVLRDSAVLVEDGRIAAVGGDLDLTGAEQVDLGGRYLAPGLFDCHVHLFSNLAAVQSEIKNMSEFDKAMYCIQNAETMLKSGVTFVRDVGTSNRAACELKKNVLNGKIKMSPDLLVSASAICMTGGACWGVISMEADGADECAKMARLQIREGADYVKLYSSGSILTAGMDPESPQLNVEELRACVNAAHDAGKKVCCHAQNARSIKNSILAGVDHIEHGIGIDEEAVAMMLEHGTWLDATVSGACSILEGADQLLPEVRDKAIRSETVSYESFIKAYRAGVPQPAAATRAPASAISTPRPRR